MPETEQFYSADDVFETARTLYDNISVTQTELAELINHARRHSGRSEVSQPAIAQALRGDTNMLTLACDIVDTLATWGGGFEREDGQRPLMYVRWVDSADAD